MRILLINLDRSPQRLAFMTEQLAARGLVAERLAAVDGSKLDLTSHRSSGLKLGEIGCFLSHRLAWQQIAASADEFSLVLEDDVRLSDRLSRLLEDRAWLSHNSQLVKLDTSRRTVALELPAIAVAGRTHAYRLCGEHTGTAGYIVSRQGAMDLLARSETFDRPVDLFMFGEAVAANPANHILQIVPAVVAQEKHFGAPAAKGLQSLIARKANLQRGPVVVIVSRELRRGLRRLGTFIARIPSRASRTRIYIRVPFA